MIRVLTTIVVATVIFTIIACRRHTMNNMDMEKNINYPAAYVVNGEDATLSVIRLSDNTVTETIELMNGTNSSVMWPHHIYKHHAADMTHLAIAVPGTDLSAGHSGGMPTMNGRILIMDAVKGLIVKDFSVPEMNHNAVYSPDGKELWTSQMGMNGKVLVYDASSYTLKNTIVVGMEPAEVTFSADGSKAYVANGGDNTVTVVNPISKAIIATIRVGDNPVASWIGYDGRMYVDNEDGQTVSVINVASNNVDQTIPLGFIPGSVAHNAIKNELWVTDPVNSKVHYYSWNAASNNWVHNNSFVTGAGAHAIAFTNDGDIAYVTNQGAATVSIINTNTHTKLKDLPVGRKPNGILIKY